MIINFCPQCGKKAEDEFIYCPFCGIKFHREEAADSDPVSEDERVPQPVHRTPVTYSPGGSDVQNKAICSPPAAAAQGGEWASPPTKTSGNRKSKERNAASLPVTAQKRKMSFTPEKEQVEKPSPSKPKTNLSPRSKKAKNVQVQPLPENDVVRDNNDTEWVLAKLLSQEKTGLYYEVHKLSKRDKERHVLKLDAKDGKIYNEQNFFQRAAKKVTVDKWKKSHNCPALGIPTCVGFGVHSLEKTCYRFLVFPELGQNLQTIISELNGGPLPKIAVYQIVYRIIDVLEYVHENEYVHGDITAENVYVSSDYEEVLLAGYYNAFRYRPDGNHVAQKDGSRTPHEGTAEFISLDVHKGAGPSRRSDLESLGYCMLKWLCGSLPWSDETNPASIMAQKQRFRTDVPGLLKQCFKKSKVPDVEKLFLESVMDMDYVEEPNYKEIRDNFSSALQKANVGPYDTVQL